MGRESGKAPLRNPSDSPHNGRDHAHTGKGVRAQDRLARIAHLRLGLSDTTQSDDGQRPREPAMSCCASSQAAEPPVSPLAGFQRLPDAHRAGGPRRWALRP